MKVRSLMDTNKGCYIGAFKGVIYPANFEVSIKKYKNGDSEKSHYHHMSDEITTIISGKVAINEKIYEQDDIIIVKRGEIIDFLALEDTVTVVVKPTAAPNTGKIMDKKYPKK